MKPKPHFLSSPLLFLSYSSLLFNHLQAQPSTEGYTCTTTNTTTSPCQSYAFYRANSPNFLDLASIGDLFHVSRLMISKPSNISALTSPLIDNQPLFVPITCSCNKVNESYSISYANVSYSIKKGDTFYLVSTFSFQNLTTYQSVQVVNPMLVPTALEIGVDVIFPVFCMCPDEAMLREQVKFMVSYVFQASDTLESVASFFGIDKKSIVDVNGDDINAFDTIFVPVKQLPQLTQPLVPTPSLVKPERKGLITGLAIGVGVCGFLLIIVIVVWVNRERTVKRREIAREQEEKQRMVYSQGKESKDLEANLMADLSDCLDKYRVFKIDELIEATKGFSDDCLVHGSVYKGSISREVYAIKKMKWNASEELKILQKVNHGNLVRLEGFCTEPEDGSSYLVYEYVENGSLHSWLHGDNSLQTVNWKTRLHIAIDVANGLQYIHEHTRPRVVHKDINSSNILLDTNMRAKIANFGLAKSGCNAVTTNIVGTQGYVPPEYLSNGVVSTKTDVFSFGVVLLELITGKEAVDEVGKLLWAKIDGVDVKRLEKWMDKRLLISCSSMESVMNVVTIGLGCLHRDPSKRPSMVDVVYGLSKSDDLFSDISEGGVSNPQVIAR